MRIPDSFLDELVARSDIVDVVSGHVRLTKKGTNYWGLCPFHREKTPSFSVSPQKQIYKCFGCGKGGGVVNFVMEAEQLPFVDAVRLLAQRANLEMPETGEAQGVREYRQRLLALNREAARYFHSVLRTPGGAAGVAYLKKRALSPATITRFGLGAAPEGWDNLITAMGEKGYTKKELLDAGLVVKNEQGRLYDRFRNRVMFPIIDLRGEVIGFGGRVLDDSTPKYLNSPDTMVYNKSRNLFALNIARKSKQGRIILTEGYMDTISLHQAGFDCAVASLGTALTSEHAQLLSRYTKEVVICYDGDGAGVSAAQRAIPLLEGAGLKIRVLQMKGAKDPDELIKTQGRAAFERLLEQSENHIQYRLDKLSANFDLSDDAQRVEFMKGAVELVASLHSAVEREVYGTRAAELAGVSPEAMAAEVKKELRRRLFREKKQQERRDLTPAQQLQPKARGLRYENVRSALAEEGVIRLVLLSPDLFRQAEGLEPEQFSSPLLGKVYRLLRQRWQQGLQVQLAGLAGQLSGEEMSHVASFADQPESAAHAGRALADYIAVIQSEAFRRSGLDDAALLRAAQQRYKENKSYGGS